MKKLSLLLVVMMAVVASAFSQKTVKEGVDWTGTSEWNQYNSFHVVANGASYDYAVERHTTKTLAQLKAGEEGKQNRYYWEIMKVSVNETVSPMTYTLDAGVEPKAFDTFPAVEDYFNNITWNKTKGDFYLIRVNEFANHEDENTNTYSLLADLKSKMVSEILVKIGDVLNIHIPTGIDADIIPLLKPKNGVDAYLCAIDAPTPKDFDDLFGTTVVKCNGNPVDGKFKVFLSVLKTKEGENNSPIEISIEKAVTIVDNYNVVDGYYSLSISLADINSKTTLDLDATDKDIYYEVTVLGYKHADTVSTEEYSTTIGSGETVDAETGWALAANEKASRTYGIYTTPKITKINHK